MAKSHSNIYSTAPSVYFCNNHFVSESFRYEIIFFFNNSDRGEGFFYLPKWSINVQQSHMFYYYLDSDLAMPREEMHLV